MRSPRRSRRCGVRCGTTARICAREKARIDHRAVRAAVLIQIGIDADAAGVMTTVDPFDERSDEQRLFIAAKRGIGIRVVEGKKIAEQLIYRPAARFDPDPDAVAGRRDAPFRARWRRSRRSRSTPTARCCPTISCAGLSKIGLAIEANFGSRPQDIEWVVVGDRIMIVQSRDYVRGN